MLLGKAVKIEVYLCTFIYRFKLDSPFEKTVPKITPNMKIAITSLKVVVA